MFSKKKEESPHEEEPPDRTELFPENEDDYFIEDLGEPHIVNIVPEEEDDQLDYEERKKRPWKWGEYEDGRHHRVRENIKKYKRRRYEKKFGLPEQWGD